ncbi:MAG: NAD(P)-dependent oxidoreductase [Gemmatimonadetes bacterium]|nr:NAD(P)-dependent oxidoreductase [Gemmatimonadota bacterium]
MSTVLLTGGTGFLGSHIAEALVADGHELRCTVRATSDTRWIDHLGVDLLPLDLGRADAETSAALAGVDTVIHCGALTRARSEAEFMAVNAEGTGRVARAAADAGVRRFILISSLAARGPDGAPGPISPYGRSKAAGERHLAEATGDMETVVIRPGGVYGPRDSDLLPLFETANKGWIVVPRSTAPVQPVYVTDVMSAVLAALVCDPPDAPLPVAGEDLLDWSGVATALSAAVGVTGRVVRVPPALFWTLGLVSEIGAVLTKAAPAMDRRRAQDMSVHSWTCRIDETKAALPGWSPQVSAADGLAKTAEWYRDIGWLR